MKFLRANLFPFVLWIEVSLLAIAFIGHRPYLGLAIAVSGGMALGLIGIVSYSSLYNGVPIGQMGKDGTPLCTPFPSGWEDIVQIKAAKRGREDAITQARVKVRRMALYRTLGPLALVLDDKYRAQGQRGPRAVQYGAEWIAAHELWFLALAIPLLILPNHAAPLGLFLISLLWLIRWVARGHLSVHTPVDIPILGLLVMTPVALYASVDVGMSRITLYQILAGAALFYGLANSLRSEKDVWQMAVLLVLAGAVLALVAPLGTNWGPSKFFSLPGVYERFPLLLPDTINANVLAGALAIIVPVGISLLLWTDSSFLFKRGVLTTRALLGLGLMLTSATFILTQSRAAYLALALGLFLLAALSNRWFLFAAMLAVLGCILVAQRLGATQAANLLLPTEALGGWPGRQEIWSRAIYMVQDFPYTGIGLGTFSKVGPIMYPYFISSPDAPPSHAHNLFLQVAVDLGLPGLVAFLGLFGGSVMMACKAYRAFAAQGRVPLRGLALGLLVSLLIMGLHGLIDAVTWGTKSTIIPWYIMGLTTALYRVSES